MRAHHDDHTQWAQQRLRGAGTRAVQVQHDALAEQLSGLALRYDVSSTDILNGSSMLGDIALRVRRDVRISHQPELLFAIPVVVSSPRCGNPVDECQLYISISATPT
jgi:hypothetical protein